MVVLDTPQITGRPAQMMDFMDAVKNVIMNNYANFSGRASRSEFWWWTLFYFLVSIPVSFIDLIIGIELIPGYGPFAIILIVGLFLPNFSLIFRRLHDTGRSGWWYWIVFLPIAIYGYEARNHKVLMPIFGFMYAIKLLFTLGEEGGNQYGSNPISQPHN